MKMNLGRYFVVLMTALTLTAGAAAQSEGPVTIVVPYGPGGNADLAARAMAFALQKQKDVPTLVVVNRPGAGGITGSQQVINAAADGKTLLLARVGSQVVAPALDPAATYKWDNFTMLGLLEMDPYACIVRDDSPYKSMKDLMDAIRAKPGKIAYASSGNLDASVVFPTKMLLNMGLKTDALLKVPYKSGPETLTAVLGGQVEFACNGLAPYLGAVTGGKARALVVSTSKRVTQLPDVPTVEEIGMKNLEIVSGWSALYGPPNLPAEVVNRWATLLNRLKTDPVWQEQVRNHGAAPAILSPQETKRFVEDQYKGYFSLREHMKVTN
jgi:tripartite-type tricarboxylate transporter receptor subunit TctC